MLLSRFPFNQWVYNDRKKIRIIWIIEIQVSDENYNGLKWLIDENFELKEALKSQRGKLCKDCPYR